MNLTNIASVVHAQHGGGFAARTQIMKDTKQKVEEGTLRWSDVHTLIKHPTEQEGGLGERIEGQEVEDPMDDDEKAWDDAADEMDDLEAFANDTCGIPLGGPADEDATEAKNEDGVGAHWLSNPENADADDGGLSANPQTINKQVKEQIKVEINELRIEKRNKRISKIKHHFRWTSCQTTC